MSRSIIDSDSLDKVTMPKLCVVWTVVAQGIGSGGGDELS